MQKLRRQSCGCHFGILYQKKKKVEQWPSTNSSGIPQTETFSVFDNICKYNKINLTKRQKKVPKQFQIVVGILGTPVGSQLR